MKLRVILAAVAVSIVSIAHAENKPVAAMPVKPQASTIPAAPATTSTPSVAPATMPVAAQATNTAAPQSEKDKVSYAIGIDLGENFKNQSIDIDPAMLSRGVKDALSSATPLMNAKEREDTLQNFQKQFRAKQEASFKQTSTKNQQEGEAYLAANKAKPGVTTTPSGLQYKVVEAGKGPKPTDKDIVSVDYEGTLINGKVFDSSYKRGKPVTFALADVIPGWKEALKLMPVGSTWEIVVPSKLAYGERGLGGPIGPNETLLFKIKLISIGNGSTKKS